MFTKSFRIMYIFICDQDCFLKGNVTCSLRWINVWKSFKLRTST